MSSDQLEGKIVRITFFNPSNNFTIAKIKTPAGDAETVLGILPAVNPGEYIKFHGYWKDHEKFGKQFMIESFEFFSPETLEEIENFLLTGTFEGLTKPIARKIIKKYGEESLTVLDQDIDRIFNEIKIPAENFESIKHSWNDQREFRRVLIFLQKLGIKSSLASKIYAIYGSQTQGILSNNPYVLLEDIPGLPFEFPDQIAFKLGFTEDADQRIEAGILHFLSGRGDDGHVYFPMERLLNECTKMLGAGFEGVHNSLYNLRSHGKLVIEIVKDQDSGENIQSVFLTELYEAEIEISRTMRNLAAMPAAISEKVKEKTVSWLEMNLDTELAEAQKRAVSAALESRVVIITGGPGTGKTTIIKSILQLLKKLKLKSLLAAPTGRAAKRMSEATDHDASTI
ncbi:MAG: helix-hairpin-helix domain-containing protein, partial [Syntrophothermus sp.]